MQRLTGLDASFLYLETPRQLLHVCALLTLDPATIPGDRTVDGFRDGQLAVIAELHHAGIDGVSGANLISYLASLEPDAPLPELPSEELPPPSAADVIGAGLTGFARRPVELTR